MQTITEYKIILLISEEKMERLKRYIEQCSGTDQYYNLCIKITDVGRRGVFKGRARDETVLMSAGGARDVVVCGGGELCERATKISTNGGPGTAGSKTFAKRSHDHVVINCKIIERELFPIHPFG